MATFVVAADLSIGRPTTPEGWILLVFAGILGLFIVNQGITSIVGMAKDPLKRNVLFFGALLALVLFAANEANWGSDPVARLDVLPNTGEATDTGQPSIGGTATNSPAAEGHDHD